MARKKCEFRTKIYFTDLKHPLIKSVYDVKNGDCVMQVIEENDADDEGDEINYE